MSDKKLYVGIGAPHVYRRTVRREADDEITDYTTVTAVQMLFGSELTPWAATIVSQTESEIVVQHVMATGDCTKPGKFRLRIDLTAPGGTLITKPMTVEVEDR